MTRRGYASPTRFRAALARLSPSRHPDPMNILSPRGALSPELPPGGSETPDPPAPPPPTRGASILSRLGRILVSKAMTFVLAAVALAVGLSTFIILARGSPLGLRAGVGTALVLCNNSALLLLGAG